MGNFFAVDARVWPKVCHAGMNPAVAYLVLAAFSAHDNVNTRASVAAIEKYTSISRKRARDAIDKLVADGFILQKPPRPRALPHYQLLAFKKVGSEDPRSKHAIWLPKAIVTGAADELPPIELLRQTQDPLLLRLFIELYRAQNLVQDGGIDRRLISQPYVREHFGQSGPWEVWGFQERPLRMDTNADIFATYTEQNCETARTSERVQTILGLGLATFVPHLVEAEGYEGEIIHPYIWEGFQERTIEEKLGAHAFYAARALLTPAQYKRSVCRKMYYLAPAPKHMAGIAMVGILQLRYRPKTSLTGAWRCELENKGELYLTKYAEIEAKAPESRRAPWLQRATSK